MTSNSAQAVHAESHVKSASSEQHGKEEGGCETRCAPATDSATEHDGVKNEVRSSGSVESEILRSVVSLILEKGVLIVDETDFNTGFGPS